MPTKDKKCAATLVSRRCGRPRAPKRRFPSLIQPLRFAYSFFIRVGVIWIYEVLRRASRLTAHREAERGIVPMTLEIQEQSLWLVPMGMAICFMVWVLWGLLKETRRRNHANGRVIHAEFISPNVRSVSRDRHLQFPRSHGL